MWKIQAEGLVDDRDDGSGAGDDDGDGDGEGLDDDPEVNYRDPPEGYLRLRPSKFHHLPATVFVEYPPELGRFSSLPHRSPDPPQDSQGMTSVIWKG
jgi:hypothetical protein